jgi:hypothetical protein
MSESGVSGCVKLKGGSCKSSHSNDVCHGLRCNCGRMRIAVSSVWGCLRWRRCLPACGRGLVVYRHCCSLGKREDVKLKLKCSLKLRSRPQLQDSGVAKSTQYIPSGSACSHISLSSGHNYSKVSSISTLRTRQPGIYCCILVGVSGWVPSTD